MDYSTTITCHECKHVGMYVVSEWPPKLAICNNCTQVFKIIEHADPTRMTFGLTPYKYK